jgi:hypothetical protein
VEVCAILLALQRHLNHAASEGRSPVNFLLLIHWHFGGFVGEVSFIVPTKVAISLYRPQSFLNFICWIVYVLGTHA